MPRTRQSLPALVLHKPSGQARVRIAGRDFYCGLHGTLQAEKKYRQILTGWLATGELPVPKPEVAVAPLSVGRLILKYWRHAKRYYRKDGRDTSQVCLVRGCLKLLREHYSTEPASEFGPQKLKALQTLLVERGLTRSGVNRRVDAIRLAFKWAVAEELIPAEVYQRLMTLSRLKQGRSPAPDNDPVAPVPADVLAATLPHLPVIVADLVRLQLLSGARPGELCDLRPVDLDQSGEVWEYRPNRHKNQHHGKARLIGFGSQAQQILAPYLEDRATDAYCFSPAESERQSRAARHAARVTPISCGNRPRDTPNPDRTRPPGEQYTVAAYRRAIHRACDKAKVERWSPNQLRHARATELRKLFGIDAARAVLGHARVSTTELYAERDREEVKRVMKEVG